MNIRAVGAQLMHADGQTIYEANKRFSLFFKRA
jgi:hypothetical protein